MSRIENGGEAMAYTAVDEDQATNLLKAAGLGVGDTGLRSMRLLDGGWANSNYLLTLEDNSQLVLKVWDERTPDEVEKVTANTLWLADYGFPTPVPLMLENGERMLVVDDQGWMLIPYISGGWLPTDPASIFDLGCVLARLHAIPVSEEIPRTFAVGFDFWDELVSTAQREGTFTPFIHLLQRESGELKKKIPTDLPRGIVHGDLFPDNVIGRTGEVLALLDFEEICVDYLAFDLMMTYVGFGWKDGLPVEELWRELIDGYQSVRPLTSAEHAALPDLHRFAVVSVAAWRYWQFMINIPGTEHADRYLEMVDRLEIPLPIKGDERQI
jgi:homoserine kinase type II